MTTAEERLWRALAWIIRDSMDWGSAPSWGTFGPHIIEAIEHRSIDRLEYLIESSKYERKGKGTA